ncbi:hypothetical protein GLOIN_2v1869760 [Rhizophagus clarus]|uniref:Uncharacterized protein n=1 Tax=Rhizophagus clarus TaxID=94130 RepID=A0A8H3QGD6_9GLOM|nr:hypothetical protein GLOIN_2v1869760 [Rhizophagus clarus]
MSKPATTTKDTIINLTESHLKNLISEPQIKSTKRKIRNEVGKLHEMYLQKKKKANFTGELNVEWVWYSQMKEILSQSKAINPDYIIDSSPPDSISDD